MNTGEREVLDIAVRTAHNFYRRKITFLYCVIGLLFGIIVGGALSLILPMVFR